MAIKNNLCVKWGLLAIASLGVLAYAALMPFVASAAPSIFADIKTTAAATSTLQYMSPGAATTTITYDSLNGDAAKINSLNVVFQYTASSTAPVLLARLEDSQDGIDWYPRTVVAAVATTSLMTTPANVMSFTLSTTTDNGGSGTGNRVHESFTVAAPLRWVRVIFYVPQGTSNGGLWAEMVPVKETNNL